MGFWRFSILKTFGLQIRCITITAYLFFKVFHKIKEKSPISMKKGQKKVKIMENQVKIVKNGHFLECV